MSAQRSSPRSTYRLQLSPEFDFAQAAGVVSYLRDLAISHLYLSPIFDSVPGSTHGYDVTDPTAIRPELGGPAGFEHLSSAATQAGLGIVLDIVPNHMSASHHNPWWYDVMMHGRASQFASYFDIDWDADPDGRLVLPVLGSPPDQAIEKRELVIEGSELGYFDARFPLSPETAGLANSAETTSGLSSLIDRQHYRLMYWKDGLAELNYRRFFDVSGLVGVRVEDPAVFAATHRLVLELIGDGKITGLRVDHVDGLRDPAGYLGRLRAAIGERTYLVIEKILAPDETLPVDWPVDGTTGYESLNRLNGVFVSRDGLERLTAARADFTGSATAFRSLEHQAKVDVAEQLFTPEMDRLAGMLEALIRSAGVGPVSRDSCFAAVRTVTTEMEHYRSYGSQDSTTAAGGASAGALERALNNASDGERPALEWLGRALSNEVTAELVDQAADFRDRWQQLTGPVVGKGLEDTAFYRYAALTSLNEVGGDPAGAFVSVEDFHSFHERRSQGAHRSLNTTSTHDTKRSEDVRARINVISESAAEWAEKITEWAEMNLSLASTTDRGRSPSAEAELLFYQSLLGVFPLEGFGENYAGLADRLNAYMVKAAREAKQETSWLAPDAAYEQGLERFVTQLLTSSDGERFRESFARLAESWAFPGAVNSLGQLVLKIAMPGVPDFYQGSETWDYSLVDPDNRRPVDFDALGSQLVRMTDQAALSDIVADAYSNWRSGGIKQLVTWRGLRLRNNLPELFDRGSYAPLTATGPRGNKICAFGRQHGHESVVAVVARLSADISDSPSSIVARNAWSGTSLEVGNLGAVEWSDAITGIDVRAADGKIEVSDTFVTLPVALLVGRAV